MRPVNDSAMAAMVEQAAMVLGTGVSPATAWEAVAKVQNEDECAQIARRLAHTPPHLLGAMAHDAQRNSALAILVVCTRLSAATGTPLGGVLQEVAKGLRDRVDSDHARLAAFAGAKATAYLLMGLPLGALALGYAVGADPLAVLFGSSLGLLMLGTGVALTVAGWWWMMRLLKAATPHIPLVDPLILVDLVSKTVEAGLPLSQALYSLGALVPERASAEQLSKAGLGLENGMDTRAALAPLRGDLAVITHAAELSATTGARLAPLLDAHTRECRRARLRAVEERSAKLAVKLVLPTGLTILPAFVILGIVPIITDLVTTHFGWNSPV